LVPLPSRRGARPWYGDSFWLGGGRCGGPRLRSGKLYRRVRATSLRGARPVSVDPGSRHRCGIARHHRARRGPSRGHRPHSGRDRPGGGRYLPGPSAVFPGARLSRCLVRFARHPGVRRARGPRRGLRLGHSVPRRLVRVALVTGFTTFTLALALGWLWTISFRQSLDQANPKVIWSVMIWGVFVVALGVRAGGGLKERRSALASAIGFPVIVIVYLGLRVVGSARGFFL